MSDEARRILDGRYELLAPLGSGASGTTWRARRVDDGVEVAIKERLVAEVASFREVDRLRREGDVLARLAHPNIPQLIEQLLVEDGRRTGFYLVSELVEGPTLGAELATRSPTWRDVMLDLAGILDVLAYLHERAPAVVHGDVKPDNLIRRASDGAIVLVDFHASRTFPASVEVGLTTAIGTPGFMAPEQLTGHAEPATDIHAAACVALAILTRRPLYTLVDDHHRLRWSDAIVVPAPVRRLLGRMLEPLPSRRARDARALAAEARRIAKGTGRTSRRGSVVLAVAAAAIVAGVVAPTFGKSDATPPLASASSAMPVEPLAAVASAPVEPRLLRFPDIPGSACAARGTCVPIDEGDLAARVQEACDRADPDAPHVDEAKFTMPLAGMTPFCHAQIVKHAFCAGACVFRFVDIEAEAFQERAEQVAQAIRDVHGRELSGLRWQATSEPNRAWHWQHGALSVAVKANWRPIPSSSRAPNDIYVDFTVRFPPPPRSGSAPSFRAEGAPLSRNGAAPNR